MRADLHRWQRKQRRGGSRALPAAAVARRRGAPGSVGSDLRPGSETAA